MLDLLDTVSVCENDPEDLCSQRLFRHFFFVISTSFLDGLDIASRSSKGSVQFLHVLNEFTLRLLTLTEGNGGQHLLLLLDHLYVLVLSRRSWSLGQCRLCLVSH